MEFAVRRNHDLVHGRADTNEDNIVVGVHGLDGALRVLRELVDEGTVVDGGLLLHGGANGDALQVNDDNTFDTFMGLDAIDGLFDFLGHCFLV